MDPGRWFSEWMELTRYRMVLRHFGMPDDEMCARWERRLASDPPAGSPAALQLAREKRRRYAQQKAQDEAVRTFWTRIAKIEQPSPKAERPRFGSPEWLATILVWLRRRC